jgi:hypothetical protein
MIWLALFFDLSHLAAARYKKAVAGEGLPEAVITMSECRRPKNRVKSAKKPNETGHF